MAWLEIRFQGVATDLDETEHLLNSLGAQVVSVYDAGDQPLLEPLPGELPLWDDLKIKALFDENSEIKTLTQTISAELNIPADSIEHEHIADQNWETAWMEDFEPMQFGEKLWICPSWLQPPEKDAVNLMLDPGLAFGSGTHETTSMCMEYLDRQPPTDLQVLDYGCGSGVLSLAASLLGASHITGVDIDPQAILAANENARKNNIDSSKFNFYLVEELSAMQVDLLLANILSDTLISLASELTQLVKTGGTIILSGILEYQTEEIVNTYSHWFEINEVCNQGEWVMIRATKVI